MICVVLITTVVKYNYGEGFKQLIAFKCNKMMCSKKFLKTYFS